MKTYLVTFKPVEPYFFGNEKTFVYPKSQSAEENANQPQVSNRYFIQSEYVPSQSTVLGALRYILLPVKKSDWKYDDAEKERNSQTVGPKSFDPLENNSFGKIRKISPVFLHDGTAALIPAPFDHIVYKDAGKQVKNERYTPFSKYTKVKSLGKDCFYAEEYNAKAGVTCDYIKLSDGTIVDACSLFGDVKRVGINRVADNKGLFKKTYRELAQGYAFAVYLTLEDDLVPEDGFAYLGQGKSSFVVSFIEEENTINDKIRDYLRDGVVYFFGDAFVNSDIYEKCLFSVTKTKTYRSFKKNRNTVVKGSKLYNLISAGSIFIPSDKEEFAKLVENSNLNQIGYNETITK